MSLAHALHTRQIYSLIDQLGLLPNAMIDPPLELTAPPWGPEPTEAHGHDPTWLIARSPCWQILLQEFDHPPTAHHCRHIALQTWRHNPMVHTLWCILDPTHLTLVFAQTTHAHTPKLYSTKFALSPPLPADTARLDHLAHLVSQKGLEFALCDLMSQERMTRRFFSRFRLANDLLSQTMLHGPKDPLERHDIALTTMLRMVILYFLQARGALNHCPQFLKNRHRQAQNDSLDFYHHTLAPLFFEALNRPPSARQKAAQDLGEIPFLNGGLFDPLEVESAHPNLTWPAHVWETVLDGLFERHRFALAETLAGDEHDAIDPEVLGRVFEGLMDASQRKSSGSFYTPKHIVHDLTLHTLAHALATQSGLPKPQALHILSGTAAPPPHALPALTSAATTLTILDPAAGTGAFLVESLHLLRHLYRTLRLAGAHHPDLLDPDTFAGVQTLIHRHLYAIDISPTATKLCEVRLWLAMLDLLPSSLSGQIDQIDPLPNLSHRINCGDSLLGPLEMTSHKASHDAHAAWAPGFDPSPWIHTIQAAQLEYLGAHGPEKTAAKAKLQDAEHDLFVHLTAARCATLDAKLEDLHTLASSPDLFGHTPALPASLKRSQITLTQSKRDLLKQTHPAFCLSTRFANVFAQKGGFDAIVMNPPWVRAGALGKHTKNLLKARYSCASPSLWEGAAEAGVTLGFGAQVDLANLFLERAVELLADQGHLGALVPAKFLRSLQGCGIRNLLSHHTIHHLEDLSEASDTLFDAAVYPAILHLQKTPPAPTSSLSLQLWQGSRCHTTRLPQRSLWQGHDPRAPWGLSTALEASRFETMRHTGDPLGTIEALRPKRGVMTGKNSVFIHSVAQLHDLFGPHLHAILPFTRPLIQGRNIQPWQAKPTHRILWPFDDQGTLVSDPNALPAPLLRHFKAHTHHLTSRTDHNDQAPLWQLFRVHGDLHSHKVVWKDLSLSMEACLVGPDQVVLNTAYFIPFQDDLRAWALCALLQSAPAKTWFSCMAERASSGWRRHFAWLINTLPLPTRWATWLSGTPDPSLEALCASWRSLPDHAPYVDAHLLAQWGLAQNDLSRSSLAPPQQVAS